MLAEKGANVTGIDFSEKLIRHAKEVAKQKGFDINYVKLNYLEFDIEERCYLITMILCDFSALNPSQRKTMLNKFYQFLKPDGFVLIDAYSLILLIREKKQKHTNTRYIQLAAILQRESSQKRI